ncbi:MAG: hypothetical protein JW751_07100 [Polyangiaceae bacterium]|nr:hypothetical protein [Polyangiaceae bacterium]
MPGRSSLLFAGLAVLALACTPTPPPRWQEGGAALAVLPARWERANRTVVEILPDGTVEERGRPSLFVDRVGRVADGKRQPLAVLLPDGIVAGVNDTNLGRVGVSNASPPDSAYAWLAVAPDGSVLRFAADGSRASDGAWIGCDGPALRTCTLVTHMIAMRAYRDRGTPAIGLGFGVGF